MSTSPLEPSKGKLLISLPFLNDLMFGRSVVLLTDHNSQGSVGFILNKPLDTSIKEVLKDFPDFEAKIYLGGPVEKNSLFYIHTLGVLIKDSVEIIKGLYWGGNFESLKLLIESDVVSENDIKFFIGYSGWGPKQLDRELKENSWLVAETDAKTVMSKSSSNSWKNILKTIKSEFAVWADYPVNPSLN